MKAFEEAFAAYVGRKHGIAIKEFGAKAEVPKTGEVVTVEFVAARAGTFTFACSVY